MFSYSSSVDRARVRSERSVELEVRGVEGRGVRAVHSRRGRRRERRDDRAIESAVRRGSLGAGVGVDRVVQQAPPVRAIHEVGDLVGLERHHAPLVRGVDVLGVTVSVGDLGHLDRVHLIVEGPIAFHARVHHDGVPQAGAHLLLEQTHTGVVLFHECCGDLG
jgi:hypothetical protein